MNTISAFIDESGDRGLSSAATDHFIMSAWVGPASSEARVHALLEQIRAELGKPSGQYLTWKNLRSHADRLHIAKTIGAQNWFRLISVVSCKRLLPASQMDQSQIYLYQLRFLLERLSWLARDRKEPARYTIAHIRHFREASLRQYEAALRSAADCRIDWPSLPWEGEIDQPQRIESLQLADLVASATGAAFNKDRFGNTEQRYLREMSGRLYWPQGSVTSYGLKMHPWTESTKAAHPWIATL